MTNETPNNPNSKKLDRNADLITGAPGSHPTGTGIGTASGAAAGAGLGAIGGPVGAVIGGVTGAVVGAAVGHKAGEAHDPTTDMSNPSGTKHTDPVAAATNPKDPSTVNRDPNRKIVTPD